MHWHKLQVPLIVVSSYCHIFQKSGDVLHAVISWLLWYQSQLTAAAATTKQLVGAISLGPEE
jgi:hypothetical protein